MNLKKKENIVIIVILVVVLIAIIGVSYAAFSFSRQGSVPNKITTGSITMTYEESDNTIKLSNALPTRDATGTTRLKEGEYFDFTVSSEITGDVNINYEVSAKEVGEGTIDGSNIKLYLTKLNGEDEEQLMTPEVYNEETDSNEYTGRPAGEMSLYTSSMNASESNDYRLRMYVTEEYNPQGDGGGLTFAVKVNVYGKAGLSMEDRMMRVAGSEDFHTNEYKNNITSIVTKDNTIIPEGVIESWDISEKQNGNVIAYVEDDGTGVGTYKLTLGGEGKIVANYNMSSYFEGFSNLTTIDLSSLDTSLVTDMSYMLAGIGVQTLNLSNFDTSKVTNMRSIFMKCNNLLELDLSNFDTSKVTNMSRMFYDNSNLIELDLSNFDTSQVTDMSYMFYVTSNLTELDLSSFDTSKVTNMSGMFDGAYMEPMKLEKIIFGEKFNTSNVTNMSRMFYACANLQTLDLSGFDTSNVTDMSMMFVKCEKLTNLNLTSFDTSKVTKYDVMFQNTTNLTEVLVKRDKWSISSADIFNGSGVTDFTYV